MPEIFNMRHGDVPTDARYVGRPSEFGNPYVVSQALTREKAVAQYRAWVYAPEQAGLRAHIRRELRGKDLVCWCAPSRCHAEVLIEIANAADRETSDVSN